MYSEKDSRTAELIRNLFSELAFTKKGIHKTIDKSEELIIDLLRYTKPYLGKMWRIDKYLNNIRFYDEREWRYVPDTISENINTLIPKTIFLNQKERDKNNALLSDHFTLHFTPDDIKYIILKTEKEIDDFINEIERIKSPNFNPKIVKRLTTRIITREQILYDLQMQC